MALTIRQTFFFRESPKFYAGKFGNGTKFIEITSFFGNYSTFLNSFVLIQLIRLRETSKLWNDLIASLMCKA